jgi:hypothetical protein
MKELPSAPVRLELPKGTEPAGQPLDLRPAKTGEQDR